MHRIIAIAVAAMLSGSSAALAQLPLPIPLPLPTGTPEDRAACEPDVRRYCANALPDQLRVLGCLQDHRTRISRACQGVLTKYGQ
jgi:hypothetical protein